MLKKQPETTEAVEMDKFYALLRKEALKIFRNMNATNKRTVEDVPIVVCRKHLKLESRATDKHDWHKLTFELNTKSLSDSREELYEYAEQAFGDQAQHLIDIFLYARIPTHLKRSIKLAYIEKCTYEQIVAHLGRELEISGIENQKEIPIPTRTVTDW